jgi:type 1 fimbriae regulatory protein FimB/type 1 fimbriae regulatory protein FimE
MAAVFDGDPQPLYDIILDPNAEQFVRSRIREALAILVLRGEKIIRHAANDRDKLMILVAYRHGLRVSELIHLRWQQVNIDAGRLTVHRLKAGEDSVHPLSGREIRALRKLRRQQPVGSRDVFVTTERGGPMTRNGFYKLLEKAAAKAGIDDVHPHLLRHGTGFKLVNDGVDTLSLAAYLGHANIQNTKR